MRLLRPWDFGGTRHASHAPSPTGAAGAANRSTSFDALASSLTLAGRVPATLTGGTRQFQIW